MPSHPCTSTSSNSASYSYVQEDEDYSKFQEDEDYSNFQEQLQGLSLSTMTQSNKPESILRRRSYGLATSESPTQPSFLKFLPSLWPIRRTKVRFPPDSAMVSSTICRPYTHLLDIPTLFYSSYEIRVFKREYRQLAHEERERQQVEATKTGTSVKGSRRSRRRRSVDSYDSSQGIVEQFKRQQWRKMKRDLTTSSSSSVSSSSTSIGAHDNTFWRSKVPRGRLTTSSRGKLTGSSSSLSVPSGSTQLCRKMSSLGMDNDSEEDSWDPLNDDDDDASSCGSWIDDDSVERRKRELAAKNSSSSSSPLRPPGAAALSEDEESYIDDDSTIVSSDSFFASIFPNANSGIQDDVAKDAMYSALDESHLYEDDIDVLEQKMLEALEDSSPSPSCIPRSPPLVVDLSAGILPTGKHSDSDASDDCDDANLPSSQPQGLFSSVFDSAAEAVSILNGNSYLDHLDAPSSSSSQQPSGTSAETEKVEHVKSKRIPCNTSSHMVDTLYLF